MIVWGLFDSGNGCYTRTVQKYFKDDIKIYSIGVDVENKNDHFINLNLADYSEIFTGENVIFKQLDKLPKPDVILASPPCEAFSNASAMKGGGNAYWEPQTVEVLSLFGNIKSMDYFSIRTKKSIDRHNASGTTFKKHWEKIVYKRVNGELCAFNTLRIIERYEPKIWIIENPQTSKIWSYYKIIQDFAGIENVAHYHAYDDHFSKKPTTFYSNIYLNLKTSKERANAVLKESEAEGRRVISTSYNQRSNISLPLIKHILEMCRKELNNDVERSVSNS